LAAIQLIAGLGNPGTKYEQTRHNAGFWFVDEVARRYAGKFRAESRFASEVASCQVDGQECRLQKPQEFMNRSGRPVATLAAFYRIPRPAILVVHDDLDLPPGTVRLKQDGGHGGHNGLRDLIPSLGGNDFLRLRIGIGHPGNRNEVSDYVLNDPRNEERGLIDEAMKNAQEIAHLVIEGKTEAAMLKLHSEQGKQP